MAAGWSTDEMKLSREAAFAPAQPLSDKALELERRASALKELEGVELRKAMALHVLAPAKPQAPPQTNEGGTQQQ